MKKTIGQQIQYYRKMNHLSQQDLADYLHLSRQAISKWENDQTLPDLDTLSKLADYFKVSINEMMGVENKQEPYHELYHQLETTINHLQKSNRYRNLILSFVVILCMISIYLTLSLKQELNYQNDILQNSSSEFVPSQSYLLDSNIHVFSSDKLLSEQSYMNVTQYDLNNNTVTLDYQFTLNSYQEDTTMKIEFISDDDTFILPLEKVKDNQFVITETIPLKDYTLSLLIESGDTKQIEPLVENCALYLRHVVTRHILLSIPTNEDGELQLDKLQYENALDQAEYASRFIGTLDGKFYVELHFGNYHTQTIFDFDNPEIKTMDIPLPTNEDIYVFITYDTSQGDRTIGGFKTFGFNISDDYNNGNYTICHGS